jgi:hypothetical protein
MKGFNIIGRALDKSLTGIGVTIQFCIFLAAIFVASPLEIALMEAAVYALLALIFLGGLGIFVFALTREGWDAEPSDSAPLPSRDKRKPAAMMLATSLQRQSGCPDDLTIWQMRAPPGKRWVDFEWSTTC